jgi:tetratricopeptide (TPR) repeat protein
MAATRNPRAHTVARRWRIPPPLRGDVGFNGPEGIPVLEEIGGALGSLVWGTLRTVTAWVDTPLEERAEMFPEDAARRRMVEVLEASPPAVIEGALSDLVNVLDKPADADSAAVGIACTRVARWAESCLHPRTAAQFYQAAANTSPGNAEYALSAARAARDLADYSRAEVWLQRAVGLSRQNENWSVYGRAYLSYGNMMRQRGNMPAARRHFERALRRASRAGLREVRAKASHDLFVIELECGRAAEAEGWAREAIATYPAGHPRLPALANDVACLWVKRGMFEPALDVFRALEPVISEKFKPHLLGSMALAAGGCGRPGAFDRARATLRTCQPDASGVAEAWLEVGEGAHLLGWYDDAEEAAVLAYRTATDRQEHRIQFRAEELRTRLRAAGTDQASDRVPTAETVGFPSELAAVLVSSLQPA